MKELICNGHKPKLIMSMDGINYFACDQKNALDFTGDAMLNFSGKPDISFDIPKSLEDHLNYRFKEIIISWPDFGLPRVKPSFWKAFHQYAIDMCWKDVCLHCGAGHGRTGTALSALLVAINGMSPKEAVDMIRSKHCQEAVETDGQCYYLVRMDEYYNNRKANNKKDIPVPAEVPYHWSYSKNSPKDNFDYKKSNTFDTNWETYEEKEIEDYEDDKL